MRGYIQALWALPLGKNAVPTVQEVVEGPTVGLGLLEKKKFLVPGGICNPGHPSSPWRSQYADCASRLLIIDISVRTYLFFPCTGTCWRTLQRAAHPNKVKKLIVARCVRMCLETLQLLYCTIPVTYSSRGLKSGYPEVFSQSSLYSRKFCDIPFKKRNGHFHTAHETAICRNPPIHSFTGDRKSLTEL